MPPFIRSTLFLCYFLVVFILPGCQHRTRQSGRTLPFDHLEDLTYTLTPEFPYIPVHGLTFPFGMNPIATIPKDGVAANAWHIHEHLGTHIDAPNHFNPTGISVDEIPADDLIVPIVVIDIRQKAAASADAELTPDDIAGFEK